MSKMKVGVILTEDSKEIIKTDMEIKEEAFSIANLDKAKFFNHKSKKQIWDEIQLRDSTNINRFLESAKSTFNRANNSLLIDQVGLWKKGVYGKDPNIADALIEELKRRRWDKEAEGFMKWLTEHNYKEPWNN